MVVDDVFKAVREEIRILVTVDLSGCRHSCRHCRQGCCQQIVSLELDPNNILATPFETFSKRKGKTGQALHPQEI